ncbi:hypothetical protein, partial [Saccharophagus degradans]
MTNAKGRVKEYPYDAHRRLVGVYKDASIACPGAAKGVVYDGGEDPGSWGWVNEAGDGARSAG